MALKFRYEAFGGILLSTRPALLVYMTRLFCRLLGLKKSVLWNQQRSYLSAPTEIHFSLTNYCTAGCAHCYTDSSPEQDQCRHLSIEEVKKRVDKMAELNVFSIALGGGESFSRPDIFIIAQYIRSRGMIPNITVNEYQINPGNIDQARVFNQINLSVDSLDSAYPLRPLSLEHVTQSLHLLHTHQIRSGFNTVITRYNYPELEDLFRFARRQRVKEIEFLRLKPQGRGKKIYADYRLNHNQNRELYPLLLQLSRQYRVAAKLDCSFMPMVLYHHRGRQVEKKMGLYGCEAGNVVLGVNHQGRIHACSFAAPLEQDILDFDHFWDNHPGLDQYRNWPQNTHEPACQNCPVLTTCKGGCHPIAQFESGNFLNGDPGCPLLVDYYHKHGSA